MTQYHTLDTFRPHTPLTRQEAAAFINRYTARRLKQTPIACGISFRDLAQIDPSLLESVYVVCGLGLMRGHDGYFSPTRLLSEVEAFVLLMRAIDGKQDESFSPWYRAYFESARSKNIHISLSAEEAPISRIRFLEWIKAVDTYIQAHSVNLPKDDITPNRILGSWKLESFNTLDSQKLRDAHVSDILLTITRDNISARLCNIISGDYILEGNTISAKKMTSTEMICDNPILMSIEAAFAEIHTSRIYAPSAVTGEQSSKLTIVTPKEDIFIFTRRKP